MEAESEEMSASTLALREGTEAVCCWARAANACGSWGRMPSCWHSAAERERVRMWELKSKGG